MTEQITAYIRRLLGIETAVESYAKEKALPYLLRGFYQFYFCSANGVNFILMTDRKRGELTPGSIAKHGELVKDVAGLPVVFATDDMPAYNRGRLLQKRMPFVIPGRQLYLPFLGAALSESDAKAPKEFSSLGNPAQQILLARLNRNFVEPLSIEKARQLIPYSRISIIRAFDELEFFQIARRDAKTKHLIFDLDCKTLWRTALPLLSNPCRRIVGLEKIPDGLPVIPAGISALAEKSMLNEPRHPEYAVQVGTFNKLGKIMAVPKADAPVLLQLWSYPPDAVGGSSIDPFSLYLTLKDDSDERVQIALDEMMKGLPW